MAFAYFIGGSKEKDNRAIKILHALFPFRQNLYQRWKLQEHQFKLDARMNLISNQDGILGGFMLRELTWKAPLDVSRKVNRGSE